MSSSSEPGAEKCVQCGVVTPLDEIIFNEPDEENTQYGWLVGTCPACRGDMRVSYDRVSRDLTSRP